MAVRNSGHPILIPAVNSRAGMLVRKVFPSVAMRTVVLPHRTPGPFAQIWSPALPVLFAVERLCESDLFWGFRHGNFDHDYYRINPTVKSIRRTPKRFNRRRRYFVPIAY